MVLTRWTMAALTASPSADCASMMQSRKHCLALSARALSPLQPLPPSPVGRSNSPGYGHLKLRHLMTTGRAAELRRFKQDVYFRSLQPRRGWGVERLETTAAKHSIHVT